MKIWLDLRCAGDNSLYSMFVLEIVKELIKSKKYDLVLFTLENLDLTLPNCEVIIVNEKPWSIKENFTFKKKIENQNIDLMIFFNEYNPITYKKNYILILKDLKKLFFWPFNNSLEKHIYLKLLNSNLKNAKKIVCFDKQTLTDLNERLNIEEWKIDIIPWFFPIKEQVKKWDITLLDVKKRHSIDWEYIIYDSNDSRTKNLERILLNLKKTVDNWSNLSLVILSNEACQNLEFRKLVINNDLSKNIYFIWDIVEEKEIIEYYNQSAWVIFPSIYETFPFELNYAMKYETAIISSNLDAIKDIMWDWINYYNSSSNTDTIKTLSNIKKIWNIDYKKIFENFDEQKYVKELDKIIENIKKWL